MKIWKLGNFVFLSNQRRHHFYVIAVYIFFSNLKELARHFAAEFLCCRGEKSINGQELHSKLAARRHRPAAFHQICHPF